MREKKLKELEFQLKSKSKTLVNVKEDIAIKQKEGALISHEIKDLEKKIEEINNTPELGIKVSDHAIVRYFERVMGFDIEQIKNEILSKQVIELFGKLGGNGTYPSDGFNVIMKNSTVVTVLPKIKKAQ